MCGTSAFHPLAVCGWGRMPDTVPTCQAHSGEGDKQARAWQASGQLDELCPFHRYGTLRLWVGEASKPRGLWSA